MHSSTLYNTLMMTEETENTTVDIAKAERVRARAEAFELHGTNWEDKSVSDLYMKKSKTELVNLLRHASSYITHQNDFLFDFVGEVSDLRSRLIACQSNAIKLQEELLSCRTEQLESVESAVKSTVEEAVQNTVQTEIKSYSDIVAGTISQSHSNNITSETLKKTLKDVVEENDRSRNLMVFGLVEKEEGENLARRLDEIFTELEEKPRIEACRVGAKTPGKIRPVKVSLSNSVMTQKILAKSCRLKRSETFKTVYFAPDRTVVQRREYKKLVEERKM